MDEEKTSSSAGAPFPGLLSESMDTSLFSLFLASRQPRPTLDTLLNIGPKYASSPTKRLDQWRLNLMLSTGIPSAFTHTSRD